MSRRLICFDLDTKLLKREYDKELPDDEKRDWHNAYYEIGTYMKSHNCEEHRQGSVYFSKKDMTYEESFELYKNMCEEYSWLFECSRRFDSAEINKYYDLKQDLEKYYQEKEQEKEYLQDEEHNHNDRNH